MADPRAVEPSTANDPSGETSESTLLLNVKTLESRVYTFSVDKNIPVAAFKEKIASECGVPVGLQRLIFRGKVLKDNHLLSDYNFENGDTLHLVERQQPPPSGLNTGNATLSNSNQGQGSNIDGSVNRIGPIGHSIMLGTLNVGNPGDAGVPDLGRVIGTALNTIGIGSQPVVMQPGALSSQDIQGLQANTSSRSQDGNQSAPRPAFPAQSTSHAVQIPLGAGIALPSQNTPIPDALNTLIEFMNQMEVAFSQSVDQPNQSTTHTGNLPAIELPLNSRGLPTVEILSIVLQHAQRLLSDHAVPALSHIAGRLNQVGDSNDPALRRQVQTESVQLGMAMQHLGALSLELGRSIMTLRMGQSSAESFVNAGPAVYISPSGPNPIMVQPFPLQTNSLFGGASSSSPSPVATSSIGVSGIPRSVNIHIHAAGTWMSTGERMQGEHVNVAIPSDLGQARGSSGINIAATGVPLQPATASISGAVPPGTGVPPRPGSSSVSPSVAEINTHLGSLLANMQSGNHVSEGSTNQEQHIDYGASGHDTRAGKSNMDSPNGTVMNDQKAQSLGCNADIKGMGDVGSSSEPSMNIEECSHDRSNVSFGDNSNHANPSIPLGLGLGGLQPMKHGRQPGIETKDGDGSGASNQQPRAVGQQVLQALARGQSGSLPSGQPQDATRGSGRSVPTTRQNLEGRGDVADAMSQILHNPDLDGLLAGVSQQTGVGSPDMLRNMLQQFTQNPALRNTVNQIAQQVDSHDLGSMFSGLDRGPEGGIDLSSMMQQMMPIVSQALGGMPSISQQAPSEPILSGSTTRQEVMATNNHPQIDLQEVVQRLENQSSDEEIFRALVGRAVNLSINSSARGNVINELCSQWGLAQEFMKMLLDDVSSRFQDYMES